LAAKINRNNRLQMGNACKIVITNRLCANSPISIT
jgi:hypothetical protein